MSEARNDSADSSDAVHDSDARLTVADRLTASTGKLLKRSEAARLLGVSTATVRRMEGATLTPVLGPDGVHRFHEEHVRELVIHRVRTIPESLDAYDAEEAAAAFDLFDQDVHPVDVVKRTKLHPRAVAAMHREWVSLRGGYVVAGDTARQIAALPWLLGSRPIAAGEDSARSASAKRHRTSARGASSRPPRCAPRARRTSRPPRPVAKSSPRANARKRFSRTARFPTGPRGSSPPSARSNESAARRRPAPSSVA